MAPPPGDTDRSDPPSRAAVRETTESAGDPAGAKAKLDELKGMMDKWESDLKEMAAAPAPAPAKPEAPKKGKKS